jgi:transposase
LMRRLESLAEMRQQEVNRLASRPKAAEVIASLKAHIEYLDREIGKTKKLIGSHLEGHPGLKRQRELLTSIPGIAELTAAKLLAEVSDWSAFGSARQVAAYAGLTPRQRVSGSSVRGKPRLSKIGNAKLRCALYMPAVVALRCNPVIKAFCARLRERGLRSKALVGAAMRKLLHQVYGVLKSGRKFDPDYEIAA